jgi:hypothetical protein
MCQAAFLNKHTPINPHKPNRSSTAGLDPAPLSALPLDPAGPFTVVNALRPVAPNGGTLKLLLAFDPRACGPAREVLTLRSAKSRVRLALSGCGVAPRLEFAPAAVAASGGLNLGDALVGDAREARFTVVNSSPFPVAFTTRFVGPPVVASPARTFSPAPAAPAAAAGKGSAAAAAVAAAAPAAAAAAAPPPTTPRETTGKGTGSFFCKPAGATLAAGDSMEVVVVFAVGGPAAAAAAAAAAAVAAAGKGGGGGRGGAGAAAASAPQLPAFPAPPNPYVEDTLEIEVAQQARPLLLSLKGRAWGEGMFLAGADYPAPQQSMSAAVPALAGAVRRLRLSLPGPVSAGQTSTAALEVGSLKSSGGLGAAGEVVVEDLAPAAKAAGWSVVCEPLKTAVPLGEKRAVTVKFAPPALATATTAGAAGGAASGCVSALLGLPETVECVLRCTLRGGVPAAGSSTGDGAAEGRRLEVHCSCVIAGSNAV